MFFPQEGKELLEDILEILEDIEDVDLRRRGFFYRKLIFKNPELAKKIVCAQKPTISDEGFSSTFSMDERSFDYIGTLAAVYTKKPESFTRVKREFDDVD